MPRNFRIDKAGIAAMLKSSGVADMILDKAEDVAANAEHTTRNGEDIPVEVGYVVTDRAHGTVTLAHPAGLNVETKYGVLERAAAAAGLEVRAG